MELCGTEEKKLYQALATQANHSQDTFIAGFGLLMKSFDKKKNTEYFYTFPLITAFSECPINDNTKTVNVGCVLHQNI